jgi:hypothetical protein
MHGPKTYGQDVFDLGEQIFVRIGQLFVVTCHCLSLLKVRSVTLGKFKGYDQSQLYGH